MSRRRAIAIVAIATMAPTPTIAQLDTNARTSVTATTIVVTEVRVHGNHVMTDDDVVATAGVAIGDHIDAAALAAIESRLRDSGRFSDVALNVRHRSLSAVGPAVLIIVVAERPPLHARLQWLPLVDYTEDYGLSGGARVVADGIFGYKERLQIAATIGGMRSISAASWRTYEHSWLDRLELLFSRSQGEHPSFDRDLAKAAVGGRIARGLGPLQLGLSADWTRTELNSDENRFIGLGANIVLDTRDATNDPRDAVYGRVSFDRVDVSGSGPSVFHRLRLEGRGYKGLFGRTVLATMAQVELVDHTLPSAERPYLGGAESLRGYASGSWIGDNRLLTSVELRVPLGSPFKLSHWGVHGFVDSGTVWDRGEPFGSRPHHGIGVGAFLKIAFVHARIDLAHDLAGNLRLHFSTGNRF